MNNTAAARAGARRKSIGLTSAAAVTSRMSALAANIISVPLVLSYAGSERYGMWMAMSSLVAMLSFADLGIGNALVNRVSTAFGRDDSQDIRTTIANALVSLISIALLLTGLFSVLFLFVDWADVFSVRLPEAVAEAAPSVAVLFACFVLNIPLGIAQRIQTAVQDGFVGYVWQILGSIVSLLLTFCAVRAGLSLPWLIACLVATPTLFNALNAATYFAGRGRRYSPNFSRISMAVVREIGMVGVAFLALQVVTALSYSSDFFVISQILGPEAVTEYAVPQRLAGVMSGVIAIMLTPLWPAYGEASARGDNEWIRRTLVRSVVAAALLSAAGGLLLIFSGGWIVKVWVDGAVAPSVALLSGLALWQLIQGVAGALAMYLNGLGILRFQVVVAILACIATLALKFYLVAHWGIPGAVWSSVIAYLAVAALPQILLVIRTTKSRRAEQ